MSAFVLHYLHANSMKYLQEGIHSLLLFLGARAVKIDERLDRLEQYDVQHQQELKKVQVTLAENFSVGDALKVRGTRIICLQ
jgi:hypothetical protein